MTHGNYVAHYDQKRENVVRGGVMRVRKIVYLSLVGLIASNCSTNGVSSPRFFDVAELSIGELSTAMNEGSVTSVELVDSYLARIAAYDQRGPVLNAMITLNPGARDTAAKLDEERRSGQLRGPLHGIPIVVKDNYDTVDMPTTAGSIALATSRPPNDATQVRRLRDAGAVILGKTNMHELAIGITTIASYGGQTRNPYDPERNPGGSSGGTGAAVAASFGAFGMGSDTCGSIRIPSAHHALVGLRGTRGLASGDGIIPLSTTQDIGGPLARSVGDLALALDATVGVDLEDETTLRSEGHVPETYTAFLNSSALEGARIGIVDAMLGNDGAERAVRQVIEKAVEDMSELGATLVEVGEPDLVSLVQDVSVIRQEFKFDLNAYLRETPGSPVDSLTEIVDGGLYHDGTAGGNLRGFLEVDSLDTDQYRERINKREEVRATIVSLMDEQMLDALLYPTIRQTARPIGQRQPGSNCALSATSGLPAITVPGGYAEDDMPVGVELLGRSWSEPRLIELAYAYEQGTKHRRPPAFTPSLGGKRKKLTLGTAVQASKDLTTRARFEFYPVQRLVNYNLSVFGLVDSDVLSIDIHRKVSKDAGETGPVLRRLTGRGRARVGGQLYLSGEEMYALREGLLYLDVHTNENLQGAVRIDLVLPED